MTNMKKYRNEFARSTHKFKEDIEVLAKENSRMKEKLLDMQCRSMKNNLVFTGFHEQLEEDCEA